MGIKEEVLTSLFIPCFFITMIILVAKISSTKAYNKKKWISKNEKLEWIKSKIWILDSWYGFWIYDFVERPMYFNLNYSEEEKNKYISEILNTKLKIWDNAITIWNWNWIIPIIVANKIWKHWTVFCFDKYKENCVLLKNTFILNTLSNFNIYNLVASDGQKDLAHIWKIRRYPWYNTLTYILFDIPLMFISIFRFIINIIIRAILEIFKYKKDSSEFFDYVPVNSIDNILYEDGKKIDFIIINNSETNIDNIFYGLKKIINKYHPKIIFTICVTYNIDEHNKNSRLAIIDSKSKKFLDWLNWLNYNIYWILDESNKISFRKIHDLEAESSVYENRYWWSYIKTLYLE